MPGPSNTNKILKVNLAKPTKGITAGGSNRAMYAALLLLCLGETDLPLM